MKKFDFLKNSHILYMLLGTLIPPAAKLRLLPKHIGKSFLKMEKPLREKLLAVVKNGMMFNSFTQSEFNEIAKCLEQSDKNSEIKPLPQLVDTKTAMQHLHCDKHRLNTYLNHGYIRRVKFGHRKVMVDYQSLYEFMNTGIAVHSSVEVSHE